MKNVLLTGGGTGGHLAIVKSVKEELLKRGVDVYYIGSLSGQDRLWFEQDCDFKDKLFLSTSGVVNKRGLEKASSLLKLGSAIFKAKSFMKNHKIESVLSVGGFSAAAASFASIITKTPLFIHEQNAIPGRLNQILKPFARQFFSSYGENRIDYPVSTQFFKSARVRTKVESVIFLGGSQGAKAINDFAIQLAPELKRKGINIIHQSGKADFERVKRAYKELKVDADLFDFDKDLVSKIFKADLAVSRAGASTVWELTAAQIPTLFIPYPYAAGDHQYYNALHHEKEGAGWVVRQDMLTQEIFWNIFDSDIEKVSRRLKRLISPNGVGKIVDLILTFEPHANYQNQPYNI